MDKICPRCLGPIRGYPALSRRDNATNICGQCDQDEAIIDLYNALHNPLSPDQAAKEERLARHITETMLVTVRQRLQSNGLTASVVDELLIHKDLDHLFFLSEASPEEIMDWYSDRYTN